MYSLIDELERIIIVLREAGMPFEVVGGAAVNVHVLEARRSRSIVTRDIDLLVDRKDLERIASAAGAAGYQSRRR